MEGWGKKEKKLHWYERRKLEGDKKDSGQKRKQAERNQIV